MEYLKECYYFWNDGGPINWLILFSSIFLFAELLKKNSKQFLSILVNVFAPLGLLGTVMGMIQTFQLISSGNIDKISEGISVALLTTLTGISISVIGLIMLITKKV